MAAKSQSTGWVVPVEFQASRQHIQLNPAILERRASSYQKWKRWARAAYVPPIRLHTSHVIVKQYPINTIENSQEEG